MEIYTSLKHGDVDVCIVSYEKMYKTSLCCENNKSHRHDVTLCVHTSYWFCNLGCTKSFPTPVLHGKIDSLLSPLSKWGSEGSEGTEKFIVHTLIAELNRQESYPQLWDLVSQNPSLLSTVAYPRRMGWHLPEHTLMQVVYKMRGHCFVLFLCFP